MSQKCQGKNCNSTDGANHSLECQFEHFMAYTGGHEQPTDIRSMLEKAYFDGHEAGAAIHVTRGTSDGSTASYYELPAGATELQELISHRDMNAQIGEIFRACYRYGIVAHSPKKRDIKKIIFYAQAELKRLEALDHGG